MNRPGDAAGRRVLVCGAGSIGVRHLENLAALGVGDLCACDPDGERLDRARARVRGLATFPDIAEGLAAFAPDVVFVATPPVMHVANALSALRAGAHVFIEKPLSNAHAGIEELERETAESGRTCQVGYNLRYHPGVLRMRELLVSGAIGRILYARAEVGQYLPDWRPGRDYRKDYTARRALGGGIVLDASHELDCLVWFLGMPLEVFCMSGRLSDLEMDAEDAATILLRLPGGVQADVHVDCIQRAYARSLKLVGTEGTALLDYPGNRVRLYRAERASWEDLEYSFQANDMYLDEVRDFLGRLDSGRPPGVSLEDGRKALEVALGALRSASLGRWVGLG